MTHVSNPWEYYHHPGVINGMLQFMGGDGNSWHDIHSVQSAFVTVGNLEKLAQYLWGDKNSPASSMKTHDLEGMINQHGGKVEINSSFLQVDSEEREGYPSRALLHWDIELYDNNKAWLIQEPAEVFRRVEPAYQVMKEILERYGIDFIAVATGRGYHFVTQVPADSEVMDMVIDTGGYIESTVRGKQQNVPFDSKRPRRIPIKSEQVYLGASRLQRFLMHKAIREVRNRTKTPIHFTDYGHHGISFDNTSGTRAVDSSNFGILGSLYFIKPAQVLGFDYPLHNPIVRIPRKGQGFELSLEQTLDTRRDYTKSADLLANTPSYIPEGSEGIRRLVQDYRQSGLYMLDRAMDQSEGDDPRTFDKGYRQYGQIIGQLPGHVQDMMREIIFYANPKLLEPENLHFFIRTLFDAWSEKYDNFEDKLRVAPHIAGMIRAVYEDPTKDWGRKWSRHYDALRHARYWTTEFLAKDLFLDMET